MRKELTLHRHNIPVLQAMLREKSTKAVDKALIRRIIRSLRIYKGVQLVGDE